MNGWTGRTAYALQAALRMSNEAFAEHLGIGVRTVAAWRQKPDLRPKTEMQQLLDTALEQAPPAAQSRFATLSAEAPSPVPTEGVAADAELRLTSDPNMAAALDWLDHRAGWEPGAARREVAARLAGLDIRDLQDRGSRRGRVDQQHIAQALHDYYGRAADGYGRYGARLGPNTDAVTSVLTRPDWLDLDCPLTARHDRLRLAAVTPEVRLTMDQETTAPAAARLAEALALGIRMVDTPVYRLLDIAVGKHLVAGSVGVTSFVEYAATMDLLEGELVDALSTGVAPQPGSLPLRDHYLPDLASVLDVGNRICAGGALALTAIARPADAFRGDADYLLLVQERSGRVINAARRLAVIPKGIHEPLTDLRADAQLGATLRREMEEELFGREDIDSTVFDQRQADPMHPSLLSEPMRWLVAEPGRLRMECTGFGLNLVSGNFEFASLIVIDDEDFWTRYGGLIKANWESSKLRQYSSLDADLISELVADVAWSNEGLFAMLQGLRRLREIGGDRVDLPPVEWELR